MSTLNKQIEKIENINMIRRLAWDFHFTTGLDFQDLFSEAILSYYEGVSAYDKSKGAKITSFLYIRMKNHLINYCKNEKLKSTISIDAEPALFNLPIITIVDEDENNEMQELFSGKALDLVRIIINAANTPAEFKQRTKGKRKLKEVNATFDFNQAPKMIRGQIVQYLRKRGWAWQNIWATMAEVKVILNEN